jgi:peptide/nickel transport system permease protein
VLPVIALAIGIIGWLAKFTRTAMLDALSSEYVRMARGNGIAEWSIVYRHAFKAAAIQVVTVAGLVVVGLLIGTVFVENVFGLPGLGALVVTAVTQHDVPLVEGIVITFTLIVIAVNLLIDLGYGLLDPRVRTA